MNFQRVKKFRELFFSSQWHEEAFINNNILKEIMTRANLLLKNKIIFDDALDMEPCVTPYSIIDYKWNDFPGNDPEWCFMLNRQGYLVDLAISFKLTNDKSYFLKYKELVFDFIQNNGVPTEENKNSWRSMDVGIRLSNLIKSFTYIDIENLLTNHEMEILKKSIYIHIDHIINVYADRYDLSNWGVLSITGLAAVELFFPQLINSDTHFFIWGKIEKQIKLQFSNDGLHWEQSPLYHHQVVTSLLYLNLISDYLDIELPINLNKKLETPINSSYYYANGNDIIVPLNDSDRVNLSYIYNIYRHMGFIGSNPTNNDSILFIGSLYGDKKHYSNNATMKEVFIGKESGYNAIKDKKLLFTFYNGLHGNGHGHASQGSFTLDINNKPIIIDSGRYTYMNHPMRIKLKLEEAHNSVSVRGFPATKIKGTWEFSKIAEPLHHNYLDTPYGSLFSTSWSGRGPFNNLYIIRRTILYIKEFDSFIFYDNIQSNSLFPLKVDINFNLNDSVQLLKKTNKKIELINDDTEIQIWAIKGNYKVTEQTMSKIYNQKNKHKRITNTLNVTKKIYGTINVISMDSNTRITKEKAFQTTNDTTIKETDDIEGVKLENADKSYKIFFKNNEIIKGDPLFKTDNDESFYGAINVINQDGKSVRIL